MARSAICAIHSIRGMRLNGKPIAARQNSKPVQAGTDRFNIKLTLRTKMLTGNNGPDPNIAKRKWKPQTKQEQQLNKIPPLFFQVEKILLEVPV